MCLLTNARDLEAFAGPFAVEVPVVVLYDCASRGPLCFLRSISFAHLKVTSLKARRGPGNLSAMRFPLLALLLVASAFAGAVAEVSLKDRANVLKDRISALESELADLKGVAKSLRESRGSANHGGRSLAANTTTNSTPAVIFQVRMKPCYCSCCPPSWDVMGVYFAEGDALPGFLGPPVFPGSSSCCHFNMY